jgi:hypothetical protein
MALHRVAGPRCPMMAALFRWELVGVVVWTGHWTFVGLNGPYAWRRTVTDGGVLVLMSGQVTS